MLGADDPHSADLDAPPSADSEHSGYLLISPHLDDAVLSCGRLMARQGGATVLTALAGSPTRWDTLTGWDADCGFATGDDVLAERLSEDRAALGVLGARQRCIKGLDNQYGPQTGRSAIIRDGIESALAQLRPRCCAIPLGLCHTDHIDVRQIALSVASTTRSPTDWIVYEDLPYGPLDGDGQFHRKAFAAYAGAGFELDEVRPELDPTMELKATAVEQYGSQLLGLRRVPRFDQYLVTERYWNLVRRASVTRARCH